MLNRHLLSALLGACLVTSTASGVERNWQGNAGTSLWNGFLNWTPLGAPQTDDDVRLGVIEILGADFFTRLDIDYQLSSLVITRGADVNTNGAELSVFGDTTIGGETTGANSSSRLVVEPTTGGGSSAAFQGYFVEVQSDGALVLNGALAEVTTPEGGLGGLTVRSGGQLSGHGTLLLNRTGGPNVGRYTNFGTLQVARAIGAPLTERFVLSIDSDNPTETMVRLSQTTASEVSLAPMTTLDINPLFVSDQFNGTLNLGAGSILDARDAPNSVLTTGSNAEINVDAESNTPGVPDIATVRGLIMVLPNGAALNIDSGALLLEESLSVGSSSEVNLSDNTELIIDQLTTTLPINSISGDLNLNGAGIKLTFNSDVSIFDTLFDWDGQEDAITTINTGATLLINNADIETGADNAFNGTIRVLGGVLKPVISGGWTMAGEMDLVEGRVESSTEMRVSGGTVGARSGINKFFVPVAFDTSATIAFGNAQSRLEIHDTATIDASTTFTGPGTLLVGESGQLTVTDGTDVSVNVENDGEIHLANGIGSMEMPSFNQNETGTLFYELGGDFPLDHDRIFVGGAAKLDGGLDLQLVNGYVPAPGDELSLLFANLLEGKFDETVVKFPMLPNHLTFELQYSANTVTLSFQSAFSADLDNDGDVDGADFLAIQRTDPTLISAWQSQFGSGPSNLAAANVPEPASWMLALAFVAVLGHRRLNR